MTKKEYEKEYESLKAMGLTNEEIEGMIEFFEINLEEEEPKKIRIINSRRKQNV